MTRISALLRARLRARLRSVCWLDAVPTVRALMSQSGRVRPIKQVARKS